MRTADDQPADKLKTSGRLDGARGHMLMPSALKSKIPRMQAQEDVEDPIVYAKFFSPYSGAVWLVTEYDGRDEMFGWADLGFGMGELGYISLNELDNANRRGLPLVERDMYFKPMPLSKAKRQSKNAARNPFLQSLDPDQERLAEELHLMAENEGSFYQKRDAEGAVTKAQRELRQSKTRDLDFDLKKVGPAVVKSLKARWRQSDKEHRQNQRAASMNKQAVVQEAMKRAKADPEFRKKLVAAVQKKAKPGGGPVSKKDYDGFFKHLMAAYKIASKWEEQDKPGGYVVNESLGAFMEKLKRDMKKHVK
jgi:hypothetical protein